MTNEKTVQIRVKCTETITYVGNIDVPAEFVTHDEETGKDEIDIDKVHDYIEDADLADGLKLTPVECHFDLEEADIEEESDGRRRTR